MNKIFKKIWNKRRGCFVAVSEAMTSACQKGGKAAVIGFATSLVLSCNVEAASQSNYRENIPSGPITTKDLAIEGNYHLNWSDTVTITDGGGLYTYIYGSVNSTLHNVNNSGQVYLGAWENGGTYFLNSNQITNSQTGQFHIGNYISKMEANGFSNAQNNQDRITDARQPNGLHISGTSAVVNNGQFFNRVEVRLSSGSITNNGSWTNDGVINQSGGSVSGSGSYLTNGTYNLTGGSFNNKILGNGKFVVGGGSFYTPQISGNVTLQINSGLSASGIASGGKLDNYGTFTLQSGKFSSVTNRGGATLTLSNSANSDAISNSGTIHAGTFVVKNVNNSGTINANNGVNFNGTLKNTGTFNTAGLWSFNNGNLQSSGNIKTNRWGNVFDSLGTTGSQDLNYVGLNSSVPQEVKTSLNAFFQKYVPGSVAKTLAQHASFSGGKVIITGVNITETQRADLEKAFKSQLFILSNNSESAIC